MIISILIFMVLTYLFLVIKNKLFEFVVMAGSLFLFFIPNGYIKDPRTDLDDDLYQQIDKLKIELSKLDMLIYGKVRNKF